MSKDKIIQGPWGQPNLSIPDKGPSSPGPIKDQKFAEDFEEEAREKFHDPAPTAKQILDAVDGIPRSLPAPPPPQEVKLSEDQQKAISLILAGHTFVFIAIRPTAGGADFLTALHGDRTDLRNAEGELPAVIERLYGRKGI